MPTLHFLAEELAFVLPAPPQIPPPSVTGAYLQRLRWQGTLIDYAWAILDNQHCRQHCSNALLFLFLVVL